jgi:hypothetical protein
MKNFTSVLMLWARRSIWRVLAIIAVMAAAETALFYFLALPKAGGLSLNTAITTGLTGPACAVFFALLCVLLCLSGCDFGTRSNYTLCRLSVSRRKVFLAQALYNFLCFLIFWGAQAATALALCMLYVRSAPADSVGPQTIFLAFYQNGFLHGVLPLDETVRYFENAAVALMLGIACANFSKRRRVGQWGFGVPILGAVTALYFSIAFRSDNFVIPLIVGVVVTGAALIDALALHGEEDDDDENEQSSPV